jgi:serine/threonine protein kinase
MSKTRKVIGEGSYGCVHKPSLHCKRPPTANFDYNGYVSKLMKTKRAEEELAEFVKFQQYDPNDEYHLGTPIMCKPDLKEPKVMDDVKDCQRLSSDVNAHPESYDLLVMKYGGPDLKIFCKDVITQYLKANKWEKSDKFWLEVHHLIRGIQFFKDSGIVHNDLKPQNILYDTKTNKLMFIDFGLMQTKRELIRTSKNNTNNQAVFHWSYPLDSGFMDYNSYSKYKRGTTNGYRKLVKDELIGMLVSDAKKNTSGLKLKKPEAFELFFSYINPSGKDMTSAEKYAFVKDFFDGLDEIIKLDYDDYLDDVIDSVDVHGLGFTLQYILNCFKRHNAVSESFFNKASALFADMYDSNPDNRHLNIHTLLSAYEDILLESGILTRLNKRFNTNNELVNSAPMPSPIMRKAKKEEKEGVSSKPLSTRLESIAYMDAENPTATKVCPPDKEVNPKTGRCIKKCGPGQTRNAQGRCVKSKTLKAVAKSRSKSSRSKGKSRRHSISRSPTSTEMMNEIFPELKKITPFEKPIATKPNAVKLVATKHIETKPNAVKPENISSSDSISLNTLLEIAHKQMDKERMAKINKNFPYEISSRS